MLYFFLIDANKLGIRLGLNISKSSEIGFIIFNFSTSPKKILFLESEKENVINSLYPSDAMKCFAFEIIF